MPPESSPAPPVLHLPVASHASRLPSHLALAQVERVRQAAYTLPQVVQPADLLPEGGAAGDEQLDALGYILLQKAVPGQRPSRWISPALMDEALRHLEVAGSGRGVRATLV